MMEILFFLKGRDSSKYRIVREGNPATSWTEIDKWDGVQWHEVNKWNRGTAFHKHERDIVSEAQSFLRTVLEEDTQVVEVMSL